jgi:hypothetical protein
MRTSRTRLVAGIADDVSSWIGEPGAAVCPSPDCVRNVSIHLDSHTLSLAV